MNDYPESAHFDDGSTTQPGGYYDELLGYNDYIPDQDASLILGGGADHSVNQTMDGPRSAFTDDNTRQPLEGEQ